MLKSKLVTLFTIILCGTSCAMKSGYYAKKGGKWVFVTQKTGFMNYLANPRVDDTNFNYKDSGLFHWPVPASRKISSYFGPRHGKHHDGIDIPAKRGTSVLASASGKVKFAGRMRGYGKVVVIRHPNGYHTVYAHNSRNLVKKGQSINQGEVIAQVGSTGRSTGPHLHFEIRKNNRVSNPAKYLEWVRRIARKH